MSGCGLVLLRELLLVSSHCPFTAFALDCLMRSSRTFGFIETSSSIVVIVFNLAILAGQFL